MDPYEKVWAYFNTFANAFRHVMVSLEELHMIQRWAVGLSSPSVFPV